MEADVTKRGLYSDGFEVGVEADAVEIDGSGADAT